jgi:lipopolysaccharide cholinephosphotransferase
MKTIDIDECHRILLSIAVEFDDICRKHQIRYYMLGGTMLGAVRHKGFVPWDDDMDFGVPRSDFDRLTELLSSELPPHLRVLTQTNGGFAGSNFIKIDNRNTHISDCWYDEDMSLGINIDIFPLDEGLKTPFRTRMFASYIALALQLKDYLGIRPDKRHGVRACVARCIRCLFRIRTAQLLKCIARRIRVRTAGRDSGFYVNYYGRWRTKEIVTKRIFGVPTAYEFDGCTFYGVEDADAYLAQLYGDYMQLPPECEQTVHATGMYMK